MAGLTKTKTKEVPFPNLTKNPLELPIWKAVDGPTIVQSSRNNTQTLGSSFWTAFNKYGGGYTQSNTNSAYITVIDHSTLASPVIVASIIGRYTSSGHHYFKITVDGIEYITPVAQVFSGRLVLGSFNVRSTGVSMNMFNYFGYGLRMHYYEDPGNNADAFAELDRQSVEDPMDLFVEGCPLLYAENSLKIEEFVTAVNTTTYYNYAGFQLRYLEDVV